MSDQICLPAPCASATVAACWPGLPPAWVKKLADYCDAHSQADAARKIGRSASLVNQVLKNRYGGDLDAVERATLKALAEDQPLCPVLGRISGSECLRHQRAAYTPGNHISVRLFKACRSCPCNIARKGGADAA